MPDSPSFDVPHAGGTAVVDSSWAGFFWCVFCVGGAFWERGRLLYNGVLLLLTVVLAAVHWPESRFFFANLGTYLFFAVAANILYSAAYLVEGLLLIFQVRKAAMFVRWFVLIAGAAFACVLAVIPLEWMIFADPARD